MAEPHRHHHAEHHDDLSLEEKRANLTAHVWDERYAGSDRVWSGNPNARLVEQASDLAPGSALDVACGEGGDAIWLAERGWDVTAVDVSPVALGKVREHAAARGVRVTTAIWDALGEAVPGAPGAFDLVTVSFLHVPAEDFAGIYRRIGAAVAPGGRLLVTAHHPHDVESGVRRPHGDGLLFEPDRVLTTLGAPGDGWEVEVADTPERVQDGPDGPVQVRDTVVRLRRS
ncbi:class I SAM-dependent methyltransferase [Nocardioides ultimimeridianus]